jgi:2-succinyl-5-enolpyruvyl-6-hydroxy-3-cyclohexene-1-carboxylate synthase
VPDRSEGDVSFACAAALVDGLIAGGLAGVCISPGSRSTPVTLAFARHPRSEVFVHLDERSSSFFGLGLAKVTGRPAAVVTTSGTAVANLYPAVVEAAMSKTPLIVLTADRPDELRGTGANQTIDQIRMFGPYPRWFVDASPPAPGNEDAWAELARQALAEALGDDGAPGPVHLNLPFREPLVPGIDARGWSAPPTMGGGVGGGSPADPEARRFPPEGAEVPRIRATTDPGTMSALADAIQRTERGLVLVGGLPACMSEGDLAAIGDLAAATGWPALTEPLSGLRARLGLGMAAGQHLLTADGFVDRDPPEAVLQIGAPPTTRAALALAAATPELVVVATDPAGSDPSRSASLSVPGDPAAVARVLIGRLRARGRTSWAMHWGRAAERAWVAVQEFLAACPDPLEARVARDVSAAIPDGGVLFAGSSTPIRDLDAFMAPRRGLTVVGNRGASGIDGSVSTALGVAENRRPTFALIGDLALLHDAAGLLWAGRREPGVTFVVPNNGGGGIFDLLPIASEPELDALFVTPHELDLGALAVAAQVEHVVIDAPPILLDAIRSRGVGTRIVEVPIDRAASVAARRELRSRVSEAVADG